MTRPTSSLDRTVIKSDQSLCGETVFELGQALIQRLVGAPKDTLATSITMAMRQCLYFFRHFFPSNDDISAVQLF